MGNLSNGSSVNTFLLSYNEIYRLTSISGYTVKLVAPLTFALDTTPNALTLLQMWEKMQNWVLRI